MSYFKQSTQKGASCEGQWGTEVKNMASGTRGPGFKCWLCRFLTAWPLAIEVRSYLLCGLDPHL